MANTLENLIFLSIIVIYTYVGFIGRTIDKKRYKYRIIFSLISLFLGGFGEFFFQLEKPFGSIIFGALPFIYLLCYEVFRRLYAPLIGKYPYAPFREKVGCRPMGNGYPSGRLVTNKDYIFTITLSLVPLLILFFLLTLTK